LRSGNSLSIEIEGEGADLLPKGSTNLIFQSMQTFAKHFSIELPGGLHIKCTNKIPVSSGLGSSAAAVIAGLLGARALLDIPISDQDLLKLAFSHEGHSDNISACLYGGLVISVFPEGELITKKISIKPLYAIVVLPDIRISTRQSRSVLPASFALNDGVFNLGRVALLVNSFQEGDFDSLKIAMQDQLHQPFRYGLIPGAESAISGALNAGAYGAALSGAGPSVIAFIEKKNEEVEKIFTKNFLDYGISSRIFKTKTTTQGAQVIQLK